MFLKKGADRSSLLSSFLKKSPKAIGKYCVDCSRKDLTLKFVMHSTRKKCMLLRHYRAKLHTVEVSCYIQPILLIMHDLNGLSLYFLVIHIYQRWQWEKTLCLERKSVPPNKMFLFPGLTYRWNRALRPFFNVNSLPWNRGGGTLVNSIDFVLKNLHHVEPFSKSKV
jgi:hypothetical protein